MQRIGVFDYFENDKPRNVWLTYLFISKVIHFVIWIYTLYLNREDIEKFTFGVFYLMTCMDCLVKLTHVITERTLVYNLVKYFDDELAPTEDQYEIPDHLSTSGAEKWMNKFVVSLMTTGILVSFTYCIEPLFEWDEHSVTLLRNKSSLDIIQGGLPLKNWWPFDTTNPTVYLVTYVFQSIVVISLIMYYMIINAMCYSLIFHITHRFKILQFLLKNIREISTKKVYANYQRLHASSTKTSLLQDDVDKKFAKRDSSGKTISFGHVENLADTVWEVDDVVMPMEEEHRLTETAGMQGSGTKEFTLDLRREIDAQMLRDLKTFIIYHQDLLRFCEGLETLMSPILLADLLDILIVFVVSSFQLSLTGGSQSHILTVENILELGSMIFLVCYFITELDTQVVQVSYSNYAVLRSLNG
ncbi:unnamed protein product [Timema podura]|uniref:Odorant receptor n=1 Tax=Timema podura TaxID=61482 RepID=A0ABN7NNL2_TIMPD|nr:unnamed protein product [Timema podura]